MSISSFPYMAIQEPIEPSFQSKFHKEQLIRSIQKCNDLEILRGMAMELIELSQKNSAIAKWATQRAVEAETRAREAEMNSKN